MRRLRSATRIVPFLLLPASATAQSVGPLARHVAIHRTIALEESDSVITVSPVVAPDPHGGFFVADPRESQVRLYDENGPIQVGVSPAPTVISRHQSAPVTPTERSSSTRADASGPPVRATEPP